METTERPLICDMHLDLAMNAIEWNRDLTRPLAAIRAGETHLRDRPDRGRGTVCLPEMRRGGVALCVATQLARLEHDAYSPVFGWRSPAQAWAMTQAQRAWYAAMEEAGEMVSIRDRAGLEAHLGRWSAADAYLRPAMKRPNLTVKTGAQALEIVLDAGRATGVRWRDSRGRKQHPRERRMRRL